MNLVFEGVDLWKIDPRRKSISVWRERIYFIDEGDGFTGERERVRMFLSVVAHADEDNDDGRRPQYC